MHTSKILVAHGNTRSLRTAVDVLTEAGYDVVATPDGGDAFARFFEEEPGIVLCSAQLPGLSGVSFAAMVRSQAPDTHVVVLVDPDEPPTEPIVGVPTLSEPFDLDALRAVLPELPARPPPAPDDDQTASHTTSSVFALAALKRFQRDNSLLAIVDDVGLQRIATMACHEVRTDNERVIAEGDPGDGFYLVVEGQVRVTLAEKADHEIARIGAGGFFGEMAMLSDRKRSASVWTVGPTVLLFFPREEFLPLLDAYPTMREVLSGVALKRTEENLWRSLFDDDDVQRSLGSLGETPAELAVPLPDMSDVGIDALAGEGAWSPTADAAAEPPAEAGLPRDGRAPGNTTWHAYPGLEDGSYRQAPTAPQPQVIHTGIDEEDLLKAVARAQRRGFRRGALVGALVAAAIAYGAVKMMEPEWKPTDVAPVVEEEHTPTKEERRELREEARKGEEKVEQAKAEQAKTEEPRTEQPKTAEPKTAEPKTVEPKTVEPKTVEPKTEQPKTETAKSDAPKADAPKTEAPKTTATASPASSVPPPAPASTLLESDRRRLRRDLINSLAAGDNAKAITAGLALEAGNALDWEAAYSLARAQQLSGDLTHALTRYNTFVATYPHNDYVDDAQFHVGEIYETRGRPKDAIGQYKLVANNPRSNLVEDAKARLAALTQ